MLSAATQLLRQTSTSRGTEASAPSNLCFGVTRFRLLPAATRLCGNAAARYRGFASPRALRHRSLCSAVTQAVTQLRGSATSVLNSHFTSRHRAAELHARSNSGRWGQPFQENVWSEASFEVYYSDLGFIRGGVGRQGLPRMTAECWTRDLQGICFEVGLLQRFLAVSLAARKSFCCTSQNL
jgi:hypothetical protein